jgi:hypothetical protein
MIELKEEISSNKTPRQKEIEMKNKERKLFLHFPIQETFTHLNPSQCLLGNGCACGTGVVPGCNNASRPVISQRGSFQATRQKEDLVA